MEGGCLLVVLGETLLLESPAVLLYLVFGFLLLHIRQVAIEEPILRRRFGQSYEQYCRSVPRWIPPLEGLSREGQRPARETLIVRTMPRRCSLPLAGHLS